MTAPAGVAKGADACGEGSAAGVFSGALRGIAPIGGGSPAPESGEGKRWGVGVTSGVAFNIEAVGAVEIGMTSGAAPSNGSGLDAGAGACGEGVGPGVGAV